MIRNYPEAETPCSVPATALRIVLTNLIRNAFQYTDEGHVSVQVLPDAMVFENEEYGDDEVTSEESIGLGLMLVEKTCNRMSWRLEIYRKTNGLKVTFRLKS
ncbi:ATP-binding protein [Vibrio sp. SCSIO 43137]|uniref:ATP-binding protein n=1 Tax=Vibrio sp. SCSIO 43137 TaxID=3021011 RepID=UPI0023072F20|nr:ATP-binding protein [Vibrio sp. SCSIO 43137]WCE30799.1 ATP-binding protein [Vibrio sp. SCSIO 43137]